MGLGTLKPTITPEEAMRRHMATKTQDRVGELEAEVERLRADYLNADRKAAMNAQEAGEHLAEVERLRGKLKAIDNRVVYLAQHTANRDVYDECQAISAIIAEE